MSHLPRMCFGLPVLAVTMFAQEMHDHGVPERLGAVSFPVSCKPALQQQFNRGVALLHSFAYSAAEKVFRSVAETDPQCAMAHWGAAITYFHQLWDPLSPAVIPVGREELQRARKAGTGSERERKYIDALAWIYQDNVIAPYSNRALHYEDAICSMAAGDRNDTETQVFCALALLSNASPMDKSHTKQKKAAGLLEPLWRVYPQHPGITHYLIHAYDNAELASRGLPAARAYSKIAPSAPHALHMPSRIFTRLGLWEDSIASNRAAKDAAHQQGDTGEELHAMDYLVYAYLQCGRDGEAAQMVERLGGMSQQKQEEFKGSYAMTAMRVRHAVERREWQSAAGMTMPTGAPPQVVAVAVWARGLGFGRSGHIAEAAAAMAKLRQLEEQLHKAGNDYWAAQVGIQKLEVTAWSAQAANKPQEAANLMREAADQEDADGKASGDAGADCSGARTAWRFAAGTA